MKKLFAIGIGAALAIRILTAMDYGNMNVLRSVTAVVFYNEGTGAALYTDDINETTAGHGVRIDEVLVKDNTVTATTFTGSLTGDAATASAVAVGGITGLGTGVSTWLATPSSSNMASAVTGETGTGALVFGTSPNFTTSNTITNTSGTLTNYVYSSTSLAAGAGWKRVFSYPQDASISANLTINGQYTSTYTFAYEFSFFGKNHNYMNMTIRTATRSASVNLPDCRIAHDGTTYYFEVSANSTYANTITGMSLQAFNNVTPLEFTDGSLSTADVTIELDNANQKFEEYMYGVLSSRFTSNSTFLGYNYSTYLEQSVALGSNNALAFYSDSIYNGTSSGSANVEINSYGQLTRTTSSEKYKKNIEELAKDTSKIYELSAKEFTGKNDGKQHVGLIAEEVAVKMPEAVRWERTCDVEGKKEVVAEDGKITIEYINPDPTPIPNSIEWNTLTCYLIEEMKKIKIENTDLKARLDKLEK